MKDFRLKKFTIILFFIALFATIGFVAGIPLIIVSASNSNTFGLIMGIILVVFGFYGAPMLWISYAGFKQQCRVVDAVTKENIYTVSGIATQLQLSPEQVKAHLSKAVNKNYLKGYLFDGNELKINNNKKQEKQTYQKKCENCGGNLEKDENGYYCPYCNAKFDKQD